MGLLILSKCDSHNNSWLLQFQYKKLKIKKVKAFAEENKQTDKQTIKLKLTAVVYMQLFQFTLSHQSLKPTRQDGIQDKTEGEYGILMNNYQQN